MAWFGYFEFDGTEIINAPRVEAYAQNYNLSWLRPQVRNDALGPMLGQTYNGPLTDNAPWLDSDAPESMDFMGVYPLSVTGLEDATTVASVTESVIDGGVVNRPRRATKSVVFSAALIATHEGGVEYGMRWLRTVLSGAPCQGQQDCVGSNLCYMAWEPSLPPGVDSGNLLTCLDPLMRSLVKVTTTSGPTVTGKFRLPHGGWAWTVTWTVVAGMPYEFMTERPLIAGFTDDATDFYIDPDYDDLPVDTAGSAKTEFLCIESEYRPFYDPSCPLVLSPPSVPTIPVSCFDFPETFVRRYFTIPEQEIPLWGQVVPVMTVKTGLVGVRSLRLRYYADVIGTGTPDDDPCAFCGDIVISYLPPGATFVMDGTTRQVTVLTPGQPQRRADAVVFKSDGTPFEWPELSCGFSYLTVVDLPDTEVMPVIDMSLVGKVA